MIKRCVICGAEFSAPPSDKKVTCSPACRSERARRSAIRCNQLAQAHTPEAEAKSARSEGRKRNAYAQLVKAQSAPGSQRGKHHRESKVWFLLDPFGGKHITVNLQDWARANYTLFEPHGTSPDEASERIRAGFGAIASSVRGSRSRRHQVSTYKGWALFRLPEPVPSGTDPETIEEYYRNIYTIKEEN